MEMESVIRKFNENPHEFYNGWVKNGYGFTIRRKQTTIKHLLTLTAYKTSQAK